jgi:hypothetical protein
MAARPPPFDDLIAEGALATPGRTRDPDHAGLAGSLANLAEEIGDARVPILDHADRTRQSASFAGHQAFGEGGVGHRSQSTGGSSATRRP